MDDRSPPDRYRIVEVVGRDGLATTYRAVDERTNTAVAVKVVPTPPPATPDHLAREFDIGSRLSHRNLVRYHVCFRTQDHVCLVTDLVEGEPLLQALVSGQPGSLEGPAARAFRELCDVIDYLHRENLIHGNLTPDVILWSSSCTLKLIDLGHCEDRIAEQAFPHDGFHGTPIHASPEHGKGRLVPESDYFAVGILLYEHLTRRNPLLPESPGPCFAEICARIAKGVPTQSVAELARAPSQLRYSIESLLSVPLEARRSGWKELRGFLAARHPA
ncbi:MAG TPA: protein kinase [Planctomycetota bacterium]|nr:protein kinase [Planctomycetota bacterium]